MFIVPGPLQTVQRAEFWGVVLGLQAADGIHLGVEVIDTRRNFAGVCGRWYLVILKLHRFFFCYL